MKLYNNGNIYKIFFLIFLMEIELEIYKKPKITKRVKPGQIIEASPGAIATQITFKSKPQTNYPTNVFGYVRGILKYNPMGIVSWDVKQGSCLIERVFPFDLEEYSKKDYIRNDILQKWKSNDFKIYSVIGELKNHNQLNYQDRFRRYLLEDSVTLSPEQIDIIGRRLASLISTRKFKS